MRRYFLTTAALLCSQAQAQHLLYPLDTVAIHDSDAALAYVQSRYPHTESLALRYTRQSLLGSHYNFVQQDALGRPCEGAMVVTTDQHGQLYRVFNTLLDETANCALNQPLPPRPHTLLTPPEGERVQTAMTVFDPDPRTATGRALEAGHANVDEIVIPAEAYQRVTGVEVTRKDGLLYLANDRVMAVDITAITDLALGPQQGLVSVADSEGFAFTRQDAAFRDVNAFYHLDHSLQYLESLGFRGELAVFRAPLKIDAQGQSSNNSTYLTDVGILAMGVGGVPDSEDADVVLHEFGHAINYQLVPDWKGGDSEAIGEGFGDYWAGAYSFWVQRDRSERFELDVFANWDGAVGALKARRSLNDQEARYYPEMEYRAHVSVFGTLGDQLWSTPLFQTLKQAEAVYGEAAFDEFNRVVLEGMAGMGFGMKMNDLARSTVDAAQRLYPQKNYASWLADRFRHHGILRDAVVLDQAASALAVTDNNQTQLSVALVNASEQTLAAFRAELAIPALNWHQVVAADHLAAGAISRVNESIRIPQALQCGESIALTADISVTADPAQQTQSSQQQLSFSYGVPVLSQPLQQLNQALPDARQINEGGKILLGEALFALKVPEGTANVSHDFGIQLSVSHARFSDLKVVIRTPSGRSFSLLDYQAYPLTDKSYTFTLSNTPALAQLQGEPMAGNWVLEVTDRVTGQSGQLRSWGIGAVTGFDCGETDTAAKPEDKPTADNTAQPGKSGASGGGALGLFSLLFFAVMALLRHRPLNVNNK
ncbi:proprotein convertase P-domain-containing protein [Photobacterium sp. SP02]|uniref:proprotein convertase P-domain-containing protein n=1 Tax=Photobacterium sp. SP02 TaxID=3032280 RepID=UPI003145594F